MIILFIIYIVVWLGMGFWGLYYCNDSKFNWQMATFMIMVVFIPIIAKFAKLI